jgi:hypothetical protein
MSIGCPSYAIRKGDEFGCPCSDISFLISLPTKFHPTPPSQKTKIPKNPFPSLQFFLQYFSSSHGSLPSSTRLDSWRRFLMAPVLVPLPIPGGTHLWHRACAVRVYSVRPLFFQRLFLASRNLEGVRDVMNSSASFHRLGLIPGSNESPVDFLNVCVDGDQVF